MLDTTITLILASTLLLPSQTDAFYDKDSNEYDPTLLPNCDAGPAFDATMYGINTELNDFMTDHECTTSSINNHTICWRSGNADFDSGDVAWMLCATTFVMLQTPAAGFAQAGLVKRKNAMSVIGQSFIGVVIGCVLWYAIGYSLVFGPSCGYYGCRGDAEQGHQTGFIGDITSHYFFHGVNAHDCMGSIPSLLFAAFQMTFALMVPVLVTGAWAEKFKLSSAILFMIIWPILVYYPSAHWIWGSGFMSTWGDAGVLDYAGGIVIHTSSGVASFVVALMLQKRRDFKKPDTTHNLPLTMIGVALVWVGWYSFNGGSGLKANGQAIGALTVTQISSCFSALTWAILSYREDKRIQVTHIASGALCGLAGITPASGFVLPYAGVPIGILVGLSGWYGGIFVKSLVNLDDVLDVTSLQAFPGAMGSILVGFFATTDAYPCEAPVYPGKDCGRGSNKGMGIFHGGNGELLAYQTAAVVVMCLWSALFTWITMKIIQQITGLDVSSEDEDLGLDLAYHGEKAYDIDNNDDIEDQAKVVKLINAAVDGDVDEVRKVIRKFGVHPSKVDVDGRTGLHLAAKHGHLEVVKLFIDEYFMSPNVFDLKRGTPLREAQLGGFTPVIKYLESKGAVAQEMNDSDAVTKMLHAASKGNLTVLDRHLKGGVSVNAKDYDDRTALHLAAAEGHLDATKLLLSNGANPNSKDRWGRLPKEDAIRNLHGDVSSLLEDFVTNKDQVSLDVIIPELAAPVRKVAAGSGIAEVLIAGRNGDLGELKRLKKKGEYLFGEDYDGRTALHQACQAGHLETVQYLVKQKDCNINHKDHDNMTPLGDAIHSNVPEVIEFLIQNEATVDVSHGQLCNLADQNELQELERLITAGVNPNTQDYDGRSALHIAAAKGYGPIVAMLLKQGAIPHIKDRHGGTPLGDATTNNHPHILTLLKAVGGAESELTHMSNITEGSINADANGRTKFDMTPTTTSFV